MSRSVMAVLALICGLGIQSASASGLPSADDSWASIRSNERVDVREPSVRLHHEHGSLNTSLFNVCLEQDDLRLISGSAKVCIRQSRPQKGSTVRCVEYATVHPASPAVVHQNVCTRWERKHIKDTQLHCVSWEERRVDYRDSFELKVVRLISDKPTVPANRPGGVIFSKAYEVPACASE